MVNKIIKLLGFTLIAFGILSFLLLLFTTYENFLSYIIQTYGFEEKKESLTLFITPQKYNYIKVIPITLALLGAIVIYFSKRILQIILSIKSWVSTFKQGIVQIPKNYLLIALVIITISFLIKLYYVVTMPIFYDEVATYMRFTKRGILTAMSFYPTPNNHILHSVLTTFTDYLPFSQTINLRSSNLILNTFSGFLLFYVCTKLFNEKIGLFIISIYCFLGPVMYYACSSRGYTLILLSFILCIYSAISILNIKPENKSYKYFFFLMIGAIIGFYSIPSFLYPFFAITSITFLILIIKNNLDSLYKLILSIFFTIVIVVILYTPVFLASGIDSIIGNSYVTPISRMDVLHDLINHFSITFRFLFSVPLFFGILLLLVSLIYWFVKKKQSNILLLSLYCILISPVILILHSIIPFARTWIYLMIPFLFLLGYILKQSNILNKLGPVSYIAMALIMLLLTINSKKFIMDHEEVSFGANETANYLISQNAKSVYIDKKYFGDIIFYQFKEENKNIDLIYLNYNDPISESDEYKLKNCDFLVTGSELPFLHNYQLSDVLRDEIYIYRLE